MQDELLYSVIENQAYFSYCTLYLSIFLFLDKFYHIFSETCKITHFIFCIQIYKSSCIVGLTNKIIAFIHYLFNQLSLFLFFLDC